MIDNLTEIESQIADEVLDTCQAFKGSAGVRQYFERKLNKPVKKDIKVKHIKLASPEDKDNQIYYMSKREFIKILEVLFEDFLKLKRRDNEQTKKEK